jgi:hypothetical protein
MIHNTRAPFGTKEYNLSDMTPETVSDMEPQPSGMSEPARLAGVFFEPKNAFEDIARRPSWIVPMLLVILGALAYSISVGQHIGWDRIIRHQFEGNQRMEQMPPEQREQAMAMGMKFASIGAYIGPVIGIPLYDLIVAGVLLGIVGGIMSAGVKFKQVFAIVCYAGLPGVLFSILAMAVVFLKNPDDFNMQNPLAFNPAAFMDPQTSSKFAYSLASSIDLFSIWTIVLIATGLKAAAGKKLSFAGALVAVIIPWVVVVLGKSALAGLRG